jgi:ATP-binding cassette subfamily E protein 1
MLDYLSDFVCVFYGEPGVYGIVSHPHGVREGINIYLDGFLPDENIRFRDEPVRFKLRPVPVEKLGTETILLEFDKMTKSYDGFKLIVEGGKIHYGEIIGILGPNGIGKTTFVKMLAGIINPDEGTPPQKELKVSYKPQYVTPDYDGTVRMLLRQIAKDKFGTSLYKSEIIRPLQLQYLLDQNVADLSGGELQRVAIAVCLSRDADLYLLDEPSAFLDVEQRLAAAKTIRKVVESKGAAAFVVEHDIVAQDFIADSLMIFTGEPGKQGIALPPMGLREGMNTFLKEMQITFRRDPQTGRPRVNKEGSRLDRYQKSINEYYYLPVKETTEEE